MTGKAWMILALAGAVASIGASANSLSYDSVWQCDTKKTNWYCDEERKKQVTTASQAKPVQTPNSTPVTNASPAFASAQTEVAQSPKKKVTSLSQVETIEDLRQLLKDKEDLAVMHPTEENIKEYLEVWKVSQEKASFFADQWQRVVWKNPHLDYSINHPTTAMGLSVANQQQQQARSDTMQALAQKHGIIFFFRSDCPYCHAVSRVLKVMEGQYGMDVIAASLDGGALPEYPNFKDGRNLAQKWQIQVVPALFIANKQTSEHAPIGFGAMTLEEIVDRIYALTTPTGSSF